VYIFIPVKTMHVHIHGKHGIGSHNRHTKEPYIHVRIHECTQILRTLIRHEADPCLNTRGTNKHAYADILHDSGCETFLIKKGMLPCAHMTRILVLEYIQVNVRPHATISAQGTSITIAYITRCMHIFSST
jgi:hypothetical protein